MLDYTVSTFAGSLGVAGNAAGTGEDARFNNPQGIVTADATGNLYVADFGNHAIKRITPQGVVTVFAGSTTGQAGCVNGTGTDARFNGPYDIAMVGSTLYVTDVGNHVIRRITSTGAVTTFAGLSGNPGTTNGLISAAQFNAPTGIEAIGNDLYIADFNNHSIRTISTTIAANRRTVTTYAGSNGTPGDNVDSTAPITRTNARFNSPAALKAIGNVLYVADAGNHMIRRVSTAEVTNFAGIAGNRGSFNGERTSATFNVPVGIATDPARNVYVTDYNHVIRKITENALHPTREVSFFAGFPGQIGTSNGVSSVARFNTPNGIVVINNGVNRGSILVVDSSNHAIRRLTPIDTPVPLLSLQALLRRPRRVYNLRVDDITRESYNKYNTNNDGSVRLILFFETNETSPQAVTMTMDGVAQTSTVGASITFSGIDEHAGDKTINVAVEEFGVNVTLSVANSRVTFNTVNYGVGSLVPIINVE